MNRYGGGYVNYFKFDKNKRIHEAYHNYIFSRFSK